MTNPSASAVPQRTRWQKIAARIDAYERLIRLDKPIGTLLLLWPTLTALWIASSGSPSWIVVGIFVVGTLLMRPVQLVLAAIPDRERPAMARLLGSGDTRGQAQDRIGRENERHEERGAAWRLPVAIKASAAGCLMVGDDDRADR